MCCPICLHRKQVMGKFYVVIKSTSPRWQQVFICDCDIWANCCDRSTSNYLLSTVHCRELYLLNHYVSTVHQVQIHQTHLRVRERLHRTTCCAKKSGRHKTNLKVSHATDWSKFAVSDPLQSLQAGTSGIFNENTITAVTWSEVNTTCDHNWYDKEGEEVVRYDINSCSVNHNRGRRHILRNRRV